MPGIDADSLIRAAREAALEVQIDDAKPRLFDLCTPEDRVSFEQLLLNMPPRFIDDQIADQIGEFLEVVDPTRKPKGAARDARIAEYLAGRSISTYGIWAFFPWSSRLVHVLPRDQYRAVRTARNRYKITQQEQDALYARRIGIIGLSVGNSAAVTFALERIGGNFRLADFDFLSLSNMNRLRSGAQDIGINKTVLAAREMYEIDPYLEISITSAANRWQSIYPRFHL